MSEPTESKGCVIVYVGKRRDGGGRYWCTAHHANATAKYGVEASECVAAHDPPILPSESLDLDPASYPGGVALWGSVPAVYDTTILPSDRGIHVHARQLSPDSTKDIDQTYRQLRIPYATDLLSGSWFTVDEIDAINFMVSGVFDFPTIPVACTHCGFAHLDRDWFAVHPHRKHQCHGCGRQFSDSAIGIGNPLALLRSHLESQPRSEMEAPRTLTIKQDDYPGGIQIWGSNPAIVWTSGKPEEKGIHVHALSAEGENPPVVDDTFSEVTIDGIRLDAEHVRYYMAQSALPHLLGRVVALSCPECNELHFDRGIDAYTPHINHECMVCGAIFLARQQIKRTIGNPFVSVRQQLASFTPRPIRNDLLGLRPETI